MVSTSFSRALMREVTANARNFHEGNWDVESRGIEPPAPAFPTVMQIINALRRALTSDRKQWRTSLRPILVDIVRLFWPSFEYRQKIKMSDGVEYLYERLEDAQSKELLIKLFAFRAMGHRKVKLSQNNPDHWKNIRKIEELARVGEPISVEFMNLTLQLRDMNPVGFNLNAYCTGPGGSYIFLQRQYELHRGNIHCLAEPGDVVIDAGACWGETALYFAYSVGDKGRVLSYEFIPSNIVVFEQNVRENPELASRIKIVPNPLWSVAGQTLYYVDWGPGSRVSFAKMREDFADTQCVTTTIDETVEKEGLPRIDFIKMDIEGAELNALKGAEASLKKFHPKLAISLYHSVEDFKTIPRYLDSLGLPYKFYLDHHTIYENETVLFAIPQKNDTA